MKSVKDMSKRELIKIYGKYRANDHEDPHYYAHGYPIALLPNAPKEALEAFGRMKEIWAEEERIGILSD
ncbi:MAG: hypothetical protein HDR54_04470 [Treponema sp.]|nr:hypothetical protein [Treponema sp.]